MLPFWYPCRWSEFLGSSSTLSLSCLQLFCPQQLNKAHQERKRRGMPTTWLDEAWWEEHLRYDINIQVGTKHRARAWIHSKTCKAMYASCEFQQLASLCLSKPQSFLLQKKEQSAAKIPMLHFASLQFRTCFFHQGKVRPRFASEVRSPAHVGYILYIWYNEYVICAL